MAENKIETELLLQIKEVLLKFPKYWEKNILLRNKVAEDLRSYNQKLIMALLSNELVKDTYSIKVGSTTIFKIEDFISMLRYKNYWDNSYTKYTNEIGLTSENKYLNYNTDVVLDFPHKDSVLEGGMSNEDEGKKEIYYHNILAKEEIDTLLSSKILSNIKKYDKNGQHKVVNFTERDNLIIKGNNLIALNSLKERYERQIKMIFIDPPYYFINSRASDSFNYNSNFKLSTWLIFMKNRLEISRELMKEEGLIFITIGDDGTSHLKLLCDDIFGIENFVSMVSWRKTDNQSNIGNIANVKDNVLIYAKNQEYMKMNKKSLSEKAIKEYSYEDDNGKFRRRILLDKTRGKYKYDIITKSGNVLKGPWMKSKEEFEELDKQGLIYWTSSGNETPYGKKYLDVNSGQIPSDFWGHEFGTNQRGATEIENLFGKRVFDYPKPELLLKNIIQIGSNEGDIILDFFMGSSTTQAVAHKMNRQYIGIEQMDYINTVSVPRLQKVIEGEQGGISKDVDWEGGGSFVYAELSSLNDEYVKNIQASKSDEDLETVLSTIKERAYLNFKVDLEKVSSKEQGYKTLSLKEKKEVLIQVLDMNQLYLSYSEMEDEQYKIPEDVKAFNHSFYQKDGEENE